MMKVDIERSKRGIPCMWEEGGSFTNTGEATIIADCNGNPKDALYVRTKGDLACSNHALIPIAVGDIVVECEHSKYYYDIRAYRICEITEEYAVLDELPSYPSAAGSAAYYKAYDYHCREPYYITQCFDDK